MPDPIRTRPKITRVEENSRMQPCTVRQAHVQLQKAHKTVRSMAVSSAHIKAAGRQVAHSRIHGRHVRSAI